MPYYGLYIPVKGAELPSTNNGAELPSTNNGASTSNSNTLGDYTNDVDKSICETDVSALVFENKKEALQVLKQHKDARFKEFLTEEEAIKYAQTGFEIVQNKYNDVKISTECHEKAPFRAPTKQQLAVFRRNIEYDDWEYVKKAIWDNPRYLVSSGDTPTILKEGYRYNAMHVCAIHNSPNVALLILDTISDPKFAELLIGKKNDEKSCKQLCANLLDYYLNLPEKGRNETPLHFASKSGHHQVMKILLSYPECKRLRNAQGMLAEHIICSRTNKSMYCEVYKLFEEVFYVPVLRSKDSAIPGQIGEPFVANNPPNLQCDPLTPEMEIKALAGPMAEENAKRFFRRWKTPPRLNSSVLSSPTANYHPFRSPIKPHSTPVNKPRGSNSSFTTPTANFKRRSLFNSTPNRYDYNGFLNTNTNGLNNSIADDSLDGKQNGVYEIEANDNKCLDKEEANNNNRLDNVSKSHINIFKTSFYPNTPVRKLKNQAFSIYPDQYIDDSIELTQEFNDSLLNVSDIYDNLSFKERHVKNTDVEKGLECIGRVLAKENNIEWREYWDFLEEFIDISSEKGIKKLESYLEKRQREQDQRNNKSDSTQKPNFLDVCNDFENAFRISSTLNATTTLNSSTTHQSTTPYTHVEKSLQVYARRMTKTIIHNIDNQRSIIAPLILELRRVKSLIYSFKEDPNYINVNFEKVHSRIGNLVSIFLENSQEVSPETKCKILLILQNISAEERTRSVHMDCVCSRIVEMIEQPIEQIQPENVKTEEMCSNIWSQEKNCDCLWESNSKRKTSRHNRIAAMHYKNHQLLKQQEKLQKDLDNQQKVNDEEWRNTKDVTNDSSDKDEFWSDFGGSDSEEDDVFLTPCQSPSSLILLDDTYDDSNRIFIFGNEPTKRDLDVLNAIFHVNLDDTKYPYIQSWKSAIMSYTNEEMDFFPSPGTVKKSHSFMATSSNKKDLFVHPQTPTSASVSSPNVEIFKEPILQLPTAISLENKSNSNDTSNAIINTAAASVTENTTDGATQRPLTPLNKLRGLFSAYRERLDNSPLPSILSDGFNDLQQ